VWQGLRSNHPSTGGRLSGSRRHGASSTTGVDYAPVVHEREANHRAEAAVLSPRQAGSAEFDKGDAVERRLGRRVDELDGLRGARDCEVELIARGFIGA
jgi:hypothetical protein